MPLFWTIWACVVVGLLLLVSYMEVNGARNGFQGANGIFLFTSGYLTVLSSPNLFIVTWIVADLLTAFIVWGIGDDEVGHYAIYRLMVDHARQHQGIGRAAMALLLTEIRACPDARRITICYKPGNATAQRFYASLGFIETGIDARAEMVAEIRL